MPTDALIAGEAGRPDGAELLAVTTPNHVHFAQSAAALRGGLHVMSDKPATLTLAQARELAGVVSASGRLYGLTYVYTGYPMVREAREIVRRGDLGAVRKVVVEYAQGWLSEPVERGGSKQAEWRADPAQAGRAAASPTSGCTPSTWRSSSRATGWAALRRRGGGGAGPDAGRRLQHPAAVWRRSAGRADRPQISAGARNGLNIKVYGERGGLTWSHERHTELTVDWLDGPTQVLHAASPYLGAAARAGSRIPTGHPEGFVEAFANLYGDLADAIVAGRGDAGLVPGIEDGVRGMAFVEQAVAASRTDAGWIELDGSLA